jgi:MFS family permease
VLTLGATETVSWGIVYYAFAVFLPVMERELGWSRGAMSGAFALATVLSGLCAAPVGRWLDRHGPRLLMTAGSCAATMLVLAWSRVERLDQFYVIWALLGVCMAAVLYEPAFATVTAWFDRQRTRALTTVTLMAGFASTIFMPIESWLIGLFGWREALVVLAAVLGLATIGPHGLLLRRRPEDLGLYPDGAAAPAVVRPVRGQGPATSVGQAVRDPVFRWLTLAFSLTTLVAYGVQVHLVAYLEDVGYAATFAATAIGLVGAMQVLGRILLGLLGDRVTLRLSAVVVLGVLPLALLILLLVPGVWGVGLFIALYGAAKGALTLLRPAYVVDLFGRDRFASIAGALAVPVLGANALGPVAAGVAHDWFGSYQPILWAFVALSAAASGAALLLSQNAKIATGR